MKTRVLLVDDHPMLCSGLRQELAKHPSLYVVGEAATGAAAIKFAVELAPDLIVMDVHLPDMDGITAIQEIRNILPGIKTVVFSSDGNRALVDKSLQSGACGYVLKSSVVEELVKAINTVLTGRLYISPEVSYGIIEDYRKNLVSQILSTEPLLTEREKRLLRLIADGSRNKEIAEQLKVSISSVETYRTRLKTKLNCPTTADLIRYALAQNIASPGTSGTPAQPNA